MAVASLLGVSQQSYAKIEANPSTTSFERLFHILNLLGGSISVSERMPSAAWSHRQGSDKPSVPSSETRSLDGKLGRKKSPTPAKLLPPTKKTER